MSIDLHNTGDNTTILLHDLDGEPLLLRQKFMVSALRREKENTTNVTMDHGRGLRVYKVREDIHEIPVPFARLTNLLFNPAYFLCVNANSSNEKSEYPWQIMLRGPEATSFISTSGPEEVQQAILNARYPKL